MPEPVRILLSYVHSTESFKCWVAEFARELMSYRLNVRLDQWHMGGKRFPDFMSAEVENAHFIIVLCTPEYKRKIKKHQDGEGKGGAVWEYQLIQTKAYTSDGFTFGEKIIPVLCSGTIDESVPLELEAVECYDFVEPDNISDSYRNLLLRLLGQGDEAPELPAEAADPRTAEAKFGSPPDPGSARGVAANVAGSLDIPVPDPPINLAFRIDREEQYADIRHFLDETRAITFCPGLFACHAAEDHRLDKLMDGLVEYRIRPEADRRSIGDVHELLVKWPAINRNTKRRQRDFLNNFKDELERKVGQFEEIADGLLAIEGAVVVRTRLNALQAGPNGAEVLNWWVEEWRKVLRETRLLAEEQDAGLSKPRLLVSMLGYEYSETQPRSRIRRFFGVARDETETELVGAIDEFGDLPPEIPKREIEKDALVARLPELRLVFRQDANAWATERLLPWLEQHCGDGTAAPEQIVETAIGKWDEFYNEFDPDKKGLPMKIVGKHCQNLLKSLFSGDRVKDRN